MSAMKDYRVIEDLEDDIKRLKEALLRKHGWECKTEPDCYWYWSRMWRGQRYTARRLDEAYNMQQIFAAWDAE